MSWKVFLFIGLFASFFACSSEDGPDPGPPVNLEDTVYLSFSLGMDKAPVTKGYNGSYIGEPHERFVQKVRVVLYDGNTDAAKVVKCFDYKIKTSTSGTMAWEGEDVAPGTIATDNTKFTTKARKVPFQNYYMLAIINPTSEMKSATEENQTYSQFSAAKIASAADFSISENFPMTNINDLVPVSTSNLWNTQNQAHSNPVKVTVERLVAKVILTGWGGGDIPVEYTAQVGNVSWALDITNRWTYWMRHGSGNINSPSTWYATDPNYSGLYGANVTDRSNHFDYYHALGNTPSSFSNALGTGYEYCLENTMDLNDQKERKVITRVLMRCVYKPAAIDTYGESYYVHYPSMRVYSMQTMVKMLELAEKQELLGIYTEQVYKDIIAAKMIDKYDFSTGGTPLQNGSLVTGSFKSNNIWYYHGGVNYYAVKIRHFGDDDTDSPTIEGHYGVLRNTIYTVAIELLEGVGAINLDDSEITTRSGITEDMLYKNISSTIHKQ